VLKPKNRLPVAAAALLIFLACLLAWMLRLQPSTSSPSTPTSALPYPGNPGEEERFAAAVQAQEYILYARTPDPEAAARKTVALRPLIEKAVQGTDIPPDVVSGIVFLESGGDPLIGLPTKAAGVGQFIRKVAKGYHLRVDPPGRVLRLLKLAHQGNAAALAKLRLVDQRYNPEVALPASAQYLQDHFKRLGGEMDIAVAAYHMGQGNLEHVVKEYCHGNAASPWRGSIGKTVRENHLTWTKILEEVSPGSHPKTYRALSRLKDSSWSYWYRVSCAQSLLREWQEHPDRFREKVERYKHPQPKRRYELAEESAWYGSQHRWENWDDLELAAGDAALVPVDHYDSFGFSVDKGLGNRAATARHRELIRMARPCMAGFLGYLGTNFRSQLHNPKASLRITALVRTDQYEAELTRKQGKNLFSSHSLGYAADIAIPATTQADIALKFLLNDLRLKRDICWVREKGQPHYHVCLSPEGAEKFRETFALMR
jgi:hypothetical protein